MTPAAWRGLYRIAQKSTLLAGIILATGCKEAPRRELSLQVGPDQILRFTPTSGYAQYFEIPGDMDLLRIVLASYPMSCENFVPPERGEVYVTVTVRAENGHPFVGEKIPYEGIPEGILPQDEDAAPDDKAPPTPIIWALPYIRLAEDARALPPGGDMSFSRFSRENYGVVEGEFYFSDAGDQEAATAALMGPFRVQLCHTDRDPSRASQDNEEDIDPTAKRK